MRDAEVVVEVFGRRVGLLRFFERQTERLVDGLPPHQIGPIDERHGNARSARTPGAADAVDIGLVVFGAVVVDDVRDTFDIDAACGHVGGDEDVDLAFTKAVERLFTGNLGHVTVKRRRRKATFLEVIGNALRSALGAREDDDPTGAFGLQDAGDDFGLVHVMGLEHELCRRGHHLGVFAGLGANVHRVAHVLAGETDDRARHGGREQHRLAKFGRLGQQ